MNPYLQHLRRYNDAKPLVGRRRSREEFEGLKFFPLKEKTLFVGRNSRSGGPRAFNVEDIADPVFVKIISRSHAVFKQKKDTWFVQDLNSRNGTFLNNRKLLSNKETQLEHGDIVRFGPAEKDGVESHLVFKFHVSKPDDKAAKRSRIDELTSSLCEELKGLSKLQQFEALKKLPITDSNISDETTLTFSGLDPENIKNELCCAICREVYLFAHVLPCGHTFCKKCIDRWLRSNLTCPLCRESASNLPIPSKKLDNFVRILVKASESKLVALYSSDDTSYASDTSKESEESVKSILSFTHSLSLKNTTIVNINTDNTGNASLSNDSSQSVHLHQSFAQRKKEYERECEEEKKKSKTLAGLLSKVKNVGYRFVDATKPWSTREQDRFLHGLRTYSGPARVAYCDSVSLNLDFVGRASIGELKTVCENLKVRPTSGEYVVDKEEDVDYQNWIEKDTRNVRTRLKMFIYYC